ncbi:hypothetical protein M885DRAFT_547058 [Pelagophyceae sp. CCMP2097]|nr:hypothetical protein M885DRAFT_547058 [Pelagophyceae sp. CCMP2097]
MTSRSGDARAMASPDLLAYLIKALKTPMGMIGSGPANYSEDGKGRYCRARRCLDVIGFTINPHGARGINFTELGAAVPAARVVVFTRSNRVKAAVSRVRGRALNAACGYNNIPTGGAREAVAEKRARADPRGNWTGSACKLRDDVPVDVKVLKAALVRNYASEWVVLQTAYRDLAPRDVYEITYEDLLGDQDAALGALFRWLGKVRAFVCDGAALRSTGAGVGGGRGRTGEVRQGDGRGPAGHARQLRRDRRVPPTRGALPRATTRESSSARC